MIGRARIAETFHALTSEALVALDTDTRVVGWNRGASLVFGYTEEDVLGRELGAVILPGGSDQGVRTLVEEAGATGSAAFEGVARTKSCDEIHVEVVVRLVDATPEAPAWVALLVRDTTEKTLLVREMFDQNLRLERTLAGLRAAEQSLMRFERSALAGQLAASVCHNLRNPLGAIKNGLYYVRKRVDPTADERLADQLAIMEKEIATSAKLIADLLDRVREPALERAPTPIRALVDGATSRVIARDWVAIVNDVPEDLPPALVDAVLLERCVTNIVQNGVEAFDASAAAGRGGTVTVAALRDGRRLRLTVTDDGCGIAAEHLPRVTAPLFTTKADRAGAGLSISENIVGRHGGELVVEPRDGGGTRVTIGVPEAFDA